MELVKVIITDLQEYIEPIANRFNLKKIEGIDFINIYEGKRITEEGNEKIVLILTGISELNINSNMEYLLENYIPNKIINIGLAGNLNNIDFKNGDIILPNTFIDSEKDPKALFIDYAVGNNYDLNNFGLILNGICLSGKQEFSEYEKNIDFTLNNGIDIYDNTAFTILNNASKNELLENCMVIKTIVDKSDNHYIEKNIILENSINILELLI